MKYVSTTTLLGVVCFLGATFVGLGAGAWRSDERVAAVPIDSADERVLVYIGSSTCSYCNDPDLPELVKTIIAEVSRLAAKDGRRLITVGVAKDFDVVAGIEHLSKVYRFDEVMAGRSWANIGVLKYVHGALAGPAGTPQVLVVDRRLNNVDGVISVHGEAVINRRIGLVELGDWTKSF